MPCHILVTTVLEISDPAWQYIKVPPLSPEHSVELVEGLAGREIAARYGNTIAEYAGGLPVQILPTAATLAHEQRRGRLDSARINLAPEAAGSFRAVYDRLGQPARLFLHAAAFLNPQRIILEELSRHLRTGLAWSDADVGRALDTCLDVHLLEGTADLRMHQLFNGFLRQILLSAEDQASVAQVRAVQSQRFVEVAGALAESPADTETARILMSYPLSPAAWADVGQSVPTDNGELIGRALYEIGRFEEARPWFERAVEAKQKGDVHGRIDHESLVTTLRAGAAYLRNLQLTEQAEEWKRRAFEIHSSSAKDASAS
jgi:tetratricopeptide (TPR) repeat protein